jgi:hypothetical protein
LYLRRMEPPPPCLMYCNDLYLRVRAIY